MDNEQYPKYNGIFQNYLNIIETFYNIFSKVDNKKSFLNIMQTCDGILAIAIFIIAILFCFFGSKFRKIAGITIFTVPVYSTLTKYPI